MGIIKRSLLASFVAITIVALFTHDIDAAQRSVRRRKKYLSNSKIKFPHGRFIARQTTVPLFSRVSIG